MATCGQQQETNNKQGSIQPAASQQEPPKQNYDQEVSRDALLQEYDQEASRRKFADF